LFEGRRLAMATTMDRRTFLQHGMRSAAGLGLLGAGGASALLAACGKGSGGGGGVVPVTYQLSWVKNVEFGGSYIAESDGFYRDEGTNVTLVAGGPNVAPEPQVASGKALVAISVPDFTASARAKGAKLKIIGAHFQKNPFGIMSLASNPIPNPQAMEGKKIGVQAINEPAWNAFLKVNHIDPASITKVPVQFDPQPLVAGEVDGWICLYYEEPSQLAQQGVKTHVFLFDDYGLSELSDVIIASEKSLADATDRDTLVKFMRGEIRGWEGLVADPGNAAKLATTVYGKTLGLNQQEQTREATAMVHLVSTPDTDQHGLLTMTAAKMEESVASMAAGGIHSTVKDLFTTEILDAAYGGKSKL
jgi:ABC-type nitrate/sulfonate/bicarbonate transport system substrate-binding protein